jgi:hypothetical protein
LWWSSDLVNLVFRNGYVTKNWREHQSINSRLYIFKPSRKFIDWLYCPRRDRWHIDCFFDVIFVSEVYFRFIARHQQFFSSLLQTWTVFPCFWLVVSLVKSWGCLVKHHRRLQRNRYSVLFNWSYFINLGTSFHENFTTKVTVSSNFVLTVLFGL